jgi:hypothetical protein
LKEDVMDTIHDSDGNEIGGIALSDKQRATIETGAEIVVIYHTPQLLRSLLGERNGSFMLRKDGDRVVTTTTAAVKDFVALQKAITVVRGTD